VTPFWSKLGVEEAGQKEGVALRNLEVNGRNRTLVVEMMAMPPERNSRALYTVKSCPSE
jgi:hypothetical protein